MQEWFIFIHSQLFIVLVYSSIAGSSFLFHDLVLPIILIRFPEQLIGLLCNYIFHHW